MIYIPLNRQIKKLGEIAEVINGRAYKKEELLENGKTPVLRVGNLFTSNRWYYSDLELEDNKYCNPGDLLYAWSASFGPFIWQGEKSIYHYHIWKINIGKEIDKTYLYWRLLYETENIKQKGHGVGMIHITKQFMENLSIPLPPLATQHKIVAQLDEINTNIQDSKSKITHEINQLDELWASSLSEVFEKGGGELKSINNISHKIQYGYTGKTIEKGQFRYLRITDIQNDHVNWETVPFVEISLEEAKKYGLNTGDVVFARTGATVGKSFLIDKIGEDKIFASYLIRVVPNYEYIKPEFLKYFFQSEMYWSQIIADVVGAAQPNFNGKKLGEITIPLPDIETQKSIISHLDELSQTISHIKAEFQSQLAYHDELWASVLDQAFKGELIN